MLAADGINVADPCRELFVALPNTGGDIYVQHQKVWEAMAPHMDRAGHGHFLYVMTSPRLALVRSTHLARGKLTTMPDAMLRMTVVTARQVEGRLLRLDRTQAFDKIRLMLDEHGIYPEQLAIDRQYDLAGNKAKEQRKITLPVSEIRFMPRLLNRAKAHLAWRDGIGRGKRFGCGMLRIA